MPHTPEFWWNWWVSLGVAIGTIGAVFAALFSGWFQARFFPPKLVIEVVRPEGERCYIQHMVPLPVDDKVMMLPDGEENARYYHLRVSNKRRRVSAKNMLVFLSQIEQKNDDGIYEIIWTGDIPIQWRHSEYFTEPRVIGPHADCDLCRITCGEHTYKTLGTQRQPSKSDPLFSIFTSVRVTNLDEFYNKKGPLSIILTMQARSDECDSAVAHVFINWDGVWVESDKEILTHMQIATT